MTLDDMIQRARQRFARMDLNHDGKLTKAEIDQARAQFQAQAQAGGSPGAPGGPGAGGGRGRGLGGRSLMEADANHDGVVTTDELDAETKARFAEMDANHDGTVTRDEMKAYFQAHRPPGAAGGGADQGPQGGEGPPGG